jgi:hypothetical protein
MLRLAIERAFLWFIEPAQEVRRFPPALLFGAMRGAGSPFLFSDDF